MLQVMPFMKLILISLILVNDSKNDSRNIELLNPVLITTNKPLVIGSYITAVLVLLFTVLEGNPC